MRKLLALTGLLAVLAAGGYAVAWAVGETTGTVSACATSPTQTISANGVKVGTITPKTACTTVTYTVPTTTVTTTSTVTVTDPATTATPPTTTTASSPPQDAFISYTCAHNWFVDPAVVTSGNGTSWSTAWKPGSITWGSVAAGDCVWLAKGTYSSLTISASGSNDLNRVQVLAAQDAQHAGIVTINGDLTLSNEDYVTVDGEGPDAAQQYIRVVNATIASQTNANPVVRFVEGAGSPVAAQWGSGGDFDHLWIHDINADAAVTFTARNFPDTSTGYDRTLLENSHIQVLSQNSENGSGSDGVQGCPGCTVRYSLLEGEPVASGWNTSQHQDLIQSQANWFSAYGNVFKDGADSAFDFDCWNEDNPNHFRIFNNVFIKARGNGSVRFYASGGASCISFDNIHIDHNTFVDYNLGGLSQIQLYNFVGNPTVTNSEIKDNIFYDDGGGSLYIAASSGFTSAQWNIDYNDISGGSAGAEVDGSAYTQAHGLSCAPGFSGYVKDSAPYLSSYQSLGSDLHIAASDICVKGAASDGTTVGAYP